MTQTAELKISKREFTIVKWKTRNLVKYLSSYNAKQFINVTAYSNSKVKWI